MVPLRTSALDNSGKMWQGQRFRGSEAAESVFYEVSAALTCHRCVHSHKPPVRQRAFAPAVPLKGFSTEKPPLGSSKLIPHNSSTEEQNAKNTHPLRCKLAQGPSENGLPRPSPPKQLQMEISLPSINAARYAAPDRSVFMLIPFTFKCYIPALLAFS